MRKTAVLTFAIFCVALIGAAWACPMDEGASSACPYHTPNSYAKKLAVGEKFKCAMCGTEGTVAESTPMIEHEGKFFYFMNDKCKSEFQTKVDEFYKGKDKGKEKK